MDDSAGMPGHWAPIAEKIRQYGERERQRGREKGRGWEHTHTHTHSHTQNKTHKQRHRKDRAATLARHGRTVLVPAGFLP